MKRRIFLGACLLMIVLAYSAAWAQGAVTAKDTITIKKDTVAATAKDAATITGNNAVKDSTPKDPKPLDLDKLLSSEDDDLLVGEKPKPAAAAAGAAVIDSASANVGLPSDGQLADDETANPPADSLGQAATAAPSGRRGPPPSSSNVRADTASLGPSIVEEGRTINFAQNLKDYKSPRIAMLLSLAVPGLGQAYSRNYVKAGAFGAVEVAVIGVAVYFNSVARSKKRAAYEFADKHFDIEQLKRYDERLRQEFDDRFSGEEGEEGEEGPAYNVDAAFPPYDTSFYNAAAKGTSYYYESIREKEFTPGWRDNDSLAPSLDQILSGDTLVYAKDGSAYVLRGNAYYFYHIMRVADAAKNPVLGGDWVLGYSNLQAEYNAMIKKSTVYHDAVNYTLYALLLNHIASAIDAGFTARAYNAALLGRESVWNRVSVEQQFVYTGSELSPGLALRLRF